VVPHVAVVGANACPQKIDQVWYTSKTKGNRRSSDRCPIVFPTSVAWASHHLQLLLYVW